MASRSQLRVVVWFVAALVAAACLPGCPPPTGRTRGPTPIDVPPIDCAANPPTTGQACSARGQVCVTQIACGLVSTMNNTCVCVAGGAWSCVLGPCNEPPFDGGEPTCPADPVMDRSPCTARQGGLSCPGMGFTCDGGMTESPCWCTGTQWSCQQPFCGGDGGPTDAPTGDVITSCPAMPPQGLPCRFGLMCVYDDACTTGCVCGFDGRFVCTIIGCDGGFDGGRRDASIDGG